MIISQNRISKMTQVVFMSFFMVMAASCDKPQRAVRATVKTQQNIISPGPSSQAQQQAEAMNVNYSIATIEVPSTTTAGYTVKIELKNPAGEYLPITTRHENGNNLADGVYNDSGRGLVVHIESRCSNNQCNQYTLLVTVFKNNTAVYQSYANSYADDCRFSVVMSTASFGEMYRDIGVAESRNSNIKPVGDIDNCPKN